MKRWLFLVLAALASPAGAVELGALGKFWTSDELHVPYRAIVTPGRIDDEKLPLIVFLHGDWQDGTDNESQLGGYGNGSLELVDIAIRNHIPLVYIAPETTHAYWPPQRVAAAVADALKQFPQIDPKRIYLTGISDGGTGVWDALKTWPECFAAAVPMSAMTEVAGLDTIAGSRNGSSTARRTTTPISRKATAARWSVRARWCANCARSADIRNTPNTRTRSM